MEILRLPIFARLSTFALLLSPVFAQNNTASSDNNATVNTNQCPLHVHRDFDPNVPINSTGSVNVHWNALMMDPARNDWIFTLTYNETRNRQAPYVRFDTQHYLQAYISAPKTSEAQACIHMFGGLNATSASQQRNGCDGVLDDACFNLLSNTTFNTDCSFPNPRVDWLEHLNEVCGADGISSNIASTSNAQDFTNQTCTINHPPGSTAPDDYRTWAAMGRGFIEGQVDADPTSFVWYDTYVRQTIPFLLTANFGGVTETQVVCVAPSQVVEGGREPAQKSAANLGWSSSRWTAVAVFVVVSAMSMYL